MEQHNQHNLFSIEDIHSFESLKKEANTSTRKRFLKRLHLSHEEELHTMINVLKKGTYIRPHKHSLKNPAGNTIKKGESFIALEGEGKIILFTEKGNVQETILMHSSEKTMVWIPANVFHTIVALSDFFILFENKTGPWKENEDKLFHILFPDESEDTIQIVNDWEKI